MIKFFRTIRKKFIGEKNMKSYLSYAIGEIILVIIGILIALSINNWNTQRSIIKQQEKLISQVILELKQSEEELIEIIEFHDRRALAAAYITQSFFLKRVLNDTLITNFGVPLSNRRYKPNLSMISSLINSGDIQLISSVKVRSDINAYYEDTNTTIDDILRYEEQYYRTGIEDIKTHMNPYAMRLQYKKNVVLNKTKDFDYSPFPKAFKEVPFPIQLEEIYSNQQIFTGYESLLIAFRNTKFNYEDILEETQKLLSTLNKEGYK
jgi:hypothetical protein